MIKILKEETQKRIKLILVNIFIAGIILSYFSFIPNMWIDENPSKFIFESRNLGRWIIKETIGNMMELDINKIEDWNYIRNSEQELKMNIVLSVTVTRADGTIEIIQ